jgi:SAM-dependent methyltransferase
MEENHAQWLKIAHARLYPSITNPNYLVLRRRRLILSQWVQSIPGNKLTVLDVGGQYQPYRPLIEHRIGRYIGLDVSKTAFVDVLGDGQQLPFKSDTFDLVIATATFEYLAEPRVAADEIRRVLKPGGHLMISVAGICPRVGDEEYWRFLPSGLKFVLGSFSTLEIVPEVTSIGGLLRLNAVALSNFAKYGFIRRILHHTAVPVMNWLGLALERAGISKNDQIAGNYSALARK